MNTAGLNFSSRVPSTTTASIAIIWTMVSLLQSLAMKAVYWNLAARVHLRTATARSGYGMAVQTGALQLEVLASGARKRDSLMLIHQFIRGGESHGYY